MIINKKGKDIVILKFSKTSNKIMQLTFDNKYPIVFTPLKCLTEVMLHCYLYITFIWECWCPIPWEFILRIRHIFIDWSEQVPHRCFWKIPQSGFIGFGYCKMIYPVLYRHFLSLFERLLNSRLLFFYNSMKISEYKFNFFIELIL